MKPKVIVEAASQQAAKDYSQKLFLSGTRTNSDEHRCTADLNANLSKVHVPSGAIGGLDAISSAALAGIDEVILTSRKNPKALGA